MHDTSDRPRCKRVIRGSALGRCAGWLALAIVITVVLSSSEIAVGIASGSFDPQDAASENSSREVPPPVGQSWWFFAILGVLAGAGIFGFHRARVARLLEVERIRTRIATDLHDDIGSSLTQIAILSEIARSRAEGNDPVMADLVEKIAATSRELVDAMSDVVWAINPTEDRLGDLVQRIRRFGADLSDSQNVEFHFRAPSSENGVVVDADERRETYLVFKESVNNAIKHSGCTSVESDLAVDDGWLVLRVHDDGHGFDTDAGSDGHGLASMQARARSVGGSFCVVSDPDYGTTETLRLPLGSRRRSWWTQQRRAPVPNTHRRFPRLSFGLRRPASQDGQQQRWFERGTAREVDHRSHHRRPA